MRADFIVCSYFVCMEERTLIFSAVILLINNTRKEYHCITITVVIIMSALKREIPCGNYICKGQCKIGRNASHSKSCQICDKYFVKGKGSGKKKRKRHVKAKYLSEIRAKEEEDEYKY